MNNNPRSGFTLLEILLVVAAIAILAGIVIVAINPARQLADTRDAQRHSDVQAISSAIAQYVIKHGALPDNFPTGVDSACTTDITLYICKPGNQCGGVDLNEALVPTFIAALPIDPSNDSNDYTGYAAFRLPDPSTRVVVCAPHTEGDTIISVAR